MIPMADIGRGSWDRPGRGRRFSFFATDEEVTALFAELPSSFEPYSLIATAPIQIAPRRYVQRAFDCRQLDPVDCAAETGSTAFWLRSHRLTPVVDLTDSITLDRYLSLNGLLGIQHGWIGRAGREASSIALVDRVVNSDTGEARSYGDYFALFRHLKRRIRRQLAWSTVRMRPDGGRDENAWEGMTDAARTAQMRGIVVFAAEAHRPLKG